MGKACADGNDCYYLESYAGQKIYVDSLRSLNGDNPPLIGCEMYKI